MMDEATFERFMAKVAITDAGYSTPCWLWTASKFPGGYGRFSVAGKSCCAHVVSWEAVNGPKPEGLDLDHLCRNTSCVRPSHLEAVTRRENLMRGETAAAHRAAVTQCPEGHQYSDENTYIDSRGNRSCLTCRHEKAAAYHLAHRDRRLAAQKRRYSERTKGTPA